MLTPLKIVKSILNFMQPNIIGAAIGAISGLSSGAGAAISGGLGLVGSIIGSNAAQSAANTQAAAGQNALNQQMAIYNQNTANMQPYLNLGQTGVNQLSSQLPYLTSQISTYAPATNKDIMNNMAPNYQFMLNQGLGANAQNVNVGGGGSNVARSNTMFAENYAQNAYQNALNNYMQQQQLGFNQSQTNQNNIFNRLSNIANTGLSGAGALAGVGVQTGQQVGTTLSNIGAANASGIVGSANALSGGLTNTGNSALLASLLSGNNQQNITNQLNQAYAGNPTSNIPNLPGA